MNLILVDVETAELLVLPFAGDGERSGHELVHQSPHPFDFVVLRRNENQNQNQSPEEKRREI